MMGNSLRNIPFIALFLDGIHPTLEGWLTMI
jgi:hypothetical protein